MFVDRTVTEGGIYARLMASQRTQIRAFGARRRLLASNMNS